MGLITNACPACKTLIEFTGNPDQRCSRCIYYIYHHTLKLETDMNKVGVPYPHEEPPK